MMALSSEDKARIVAEERERERVRQDVKNKRLAKFGCLPCLFFLLAPVMLIVLAALISRL